MSPKRSKLALDLWAIAFRLRDAEREHPELFATDVAADFAQAWREYEEKYEERANTDFFRTLNVDIGTSKVNDVSESLEFRRSDPFRDAWDMADEEAQQAATGIESALLFADEQISEEDRWDESQIDWVEEVAHGNRRLEGDGEAPQVGRGLACFGAAAWYPSFFLPEQLASSANSEDLVRITHALSEAHKTFIYGNFLSCISVIRVIIEAALKSGYRGSGGLKEMIGGAQDLPPSVNRGALHRIRELANGLLHGHARAEKFLAAGTYEKEREIIAALRVVRDLIEGMPQWQCKPQTLR